MKFIKEYWIQFLLALVTLLCAWAILSISIEWIPKIENSWDLKTCDSVNSVYLNLSYSFLAAFFFYILTIVLPDYNRSRKMRPVLKHRAELIQKLIDSMVLEFSRDVHGKNIDKREDLYHILDSKCWTDILSFQQQFRGISIRYIDMIAGQATTIRAHVIEFIDLYKDDMSEEQIKSLEDFIEMQIFKDASIFSPIKRLDLNHPDGKKFLINNFCDMYFEYKRIVGMF